MARDNNSDKGTFKKFKNSRINLNPNTLYEFNVQDEGEDQLVFYLGGKSYSNTKFVFSSDQISPHISEETTIKV
jgi:hypothetical protein